MRQHIVPPTPPQRSPLKSSRLPAWVSLFLKALPWIVTWTGMIILFAQVNTLRYSTPTSDGPIGEATVKTEEAPPAIPSVTTFSFSDPSDLNLAFGEPIKIPVKVENGVAKKLVVEIHKTDDTLISSQEFDVQDGENSIILNPIKVGDQYLVGEFKLWVKMDEQTLGKEVRINAPSFQFIDIQPDIKYADLPVLIPDIMQIQILGSPILANTSGSVRLFADETQNPSIIFDEQGNFVFQKLITDNNLSTLVQQSETLVIVLDSVSFVDTGEKATVALPALILPSTNDENLLKKSLLYTNLDETTESFFYESLTCGQVSDHTSPFLWIYKFPDKEEFLAFLYGWTASPMTAGVTDLDLNWKSTLFNLPIDESDYSVRLYTVFDPQQSKIDGQCIFKFNKAVKNIDLYLLPTGDTFENKLWFETIVMGLLK
jgi:hypothetical protein